MNTQEYTRGVTEDCNGNSVTVPSYQQEMWGDYRHTVDTLEDLTLLVKAMGWDSIAEFTHDTDVTSDELLGRWWLTTGDSNGRQSVHIMEQNDGPPLDDDVLIAYEEQDRLMKEAGCLYHQSNQDPLMDLPEYNEHVVCRCAYCRGDDSAT